MKKKIIMGIIIASVISGTFGCGDKAQNKNENKGSVSKTTEEDTEIEEDTLDYEWEWIINPKESKYSSISYIGEDCFIVSTEDREKSGIINAAGEVIKPFTEEGYNYWDERQVEESSEESAENGGRINAMAANGWYYDWVSKNGANTQSAEDFPDSLRNKVDGNYFFLNGNDMDVSEGGINYIDALNLEMGILATNDELKIALCDGNGNVYMKPDKYSIATKKRYNQNCVFCDGRLPVKECDGGLYGYIDVTGEEVITTLYSYAGPFQEGLAFVNHEGREMPVEYIDVNGNTVISLWDMEKWGEFRGGAFEDGYAIVKAVVEDEEGVLTERCGILKCNTEIFDESLHLKQEYEKYKKICND